MNEFNKRKIDSESESEAENYRKKQQKLPVYTDENTVLNIINIALNLDVIFNDEGTSFDIKIDTRISDHIMSNCFINIAVLEALQNKTIKLDFDKIIKNPYFKNIQNDINYRKIFGLLTGSQIEYILKISDAIKEITWLTLFYLKEKNELSKKILTDHFGTGFEMRCLGLIFAAIKEHKIAAKDIDKFMFHDKLFVECLKHTKNPLQACEKHADKFEIIKQCYLNTFSDNNKVYIRYFLSKFDFLTVGGINLIFNYDISDIIQNCDAFIKYVMYCFCNPYLFQKQLPYMISTIKNQQMSGVQELLSYKLPMELTAGIIENTKITFDIIPEYFLHDMQQKFELFKIYRESDLQKFAKILYQYNSDFTEIPGYNGKIMFDILNTDNNPFKPLFN